MFENLAYPRSKRFSQVLVAVLWILYLAVFAALHDRFGLGIAALAIFPVVGGGWYFGTLAGLAIGLVALLADLLLLMLPGHSPLEMLNAGSMIGSFDLILVGWMIGRLGDEARQRRAVLSELQGLERAQREQANFLSVLNEITQTALEASDQRVFLEFLVRRMGELFAANDCLFAWWDEVSQLPIPKAAYGPASETYPSIRYETGETKLALLVLDSRRPLAISDFQNSSYRNMMSPQIAVLLEGTKSLLGLPLVSQNHKLGLIYLTYRLGREFSLPDIERAQLAAYQVALILTKVQLFEETQQRVKALAVLHEIALATTQVDGEDQLLDRATRIIGRNLFPDNFGILLVDESAGLLFPHPSYKFYSSEDQVHPVTVQLGQGISGQVAQTGKAQRIDDVRLNPAYLKVDLQTRSELCVPLSFKDRILGVINAESTKLNAFSQDDENLLSTLAGQLATALEYLRSRQAERHWMSRLAHSNDLASAFSHVIAEIEKPLSAGEIIAVLEDELQKMGLKCLPAFYFRDIDKVIFQYAFLLPAELRLSDHLIKGHPLSYELVAGKLEAMFGIENVLAPVVLPDPSKSIRTIFSGLPDPLMKRILNSIDIGPEKEIIHLPLLLEDRLLGMLWLWGGGLSGSDLPVLSIFAKQIAIALEKARLFQEVQSLAFTDPLTGLYNRRGLFELGRVEFARSLRAGRPFSGIMLDFDHFKKVNDTYGHSIGDKVLQECADRCRKSVREVDFVGRYGGEEIIILLPETDLETSIMVAERLRRAISDTPIQVKDQVALNVTASLGVARQDENTPNLEILVARADQAMYIAKHKGRNRVAIST